MFAKHGNIRSEFLSQSHGPVSAVQRAEKALDHDGETLEAPISEGVDIGNVDSVELRTGLGQLLEALRVHLAEGNGKPVQVFVQGRCPKPCARQAAKERFGKRHQHTPVVARRARRRGAPDGRLDVALAGKVRQRIPNAADCVGTAQVHQNVQAATA